MPRPKNDYLGLIVCISKVNCYKGVKQIGCRTHNMWETECLNCGFKVDRTASHLKRQRTCTRCEGHSKGWSGFNELLRLYKNNARKENRVFELTREQFKEITSHNCHYCGIEPLQIKKSGSNCVWDWGWYYYNGIDRKDNNIGYIYENCLPSCFECNWMKHDKTYEKHLAHINRIVEFQNKKALTNKVRA